MVIVLCHSRHCFVWPIQSQQLEDVIAGLEAAWAFFGGMPKYPCWMSRVFPAFWSWPVYSVFGTQGVPRRATALSMSSRLRTPPPTPLCRVSRVDAGSDRNGATRHRPGWLTRYRGTACDARCRGRLGWTVVPAFGRCPETRGPDRPGRSKPCCPIGPVRADGRPGSPRSTVQYPARCGTRKHAGPGERCAATPPGTPGPVEQSPSPAKRCGAWWTWLLRGLCPCPIGPVPELVGPPTAAAAATSPAVPRHRHSRPVQPALTGRAAAGWYDALTDGCRLPNDKEAPKCPILPKSAA